MWSDPRFLIPPAVAAAIDRGRGRHPLSEQWIREALAGSLAAVDKLWALGPAPVTAEIYEKHRERENAARATRLEDRKRQTGKRYAEVLELYNSLAHGDPKTLRRIPLELAREHGLFSTEIEQQGRGQ